VHINQSGSPHGGSPGFEDDDKFEEQYHPQLVNLDIFGHGDIIKKVNDADNVISEHRMDSSSEEGSSARGSGSSGNLNSGGVIEGANTLVT